MTIIGLQRLATLAAMPMYVLLFPFGSLVHCFFGGIALCYAFNAVDDRDWEAFLSRLPPFPPELRVRLFFAACLPWLFVPPLLCLILSNLATDPFTQISAEIKKLLDYSLLPTSLPEYEAKFASVLGSEKAAQYVIGMSAVAIFPLAIAVAPPRILVLFALGSLRYLRAETPRHPAAGTPRQEATAIAFMLAGAIGGVSIFYNVSFSLSYDAGRRGIEPYQAFVQSPSCFFPLKISFFLVLILSAHYVVCLLLRRCRLPAPVNDALARL